MSTVEAHPCGIRSNKQKICKASTADIFNANIPVLFLKTEEGHTYFQTFIYSLPSNHKAYICRRNSEV
ncbi:MAG: hypothetical protein LUD00_00275 [Prevotellaceae bacterium]|nr:hypothetical protein [Prevotellaceae bacterium]